MPLFRFHREELIDSLSTTVIIQGSNELYLLLSKDKPLYCDWDFFIEINPYPDDKNNFDKRIGWFTQIVLTNLYDKKKMEPIGFLSEPLRG